MGKEDASRFSAEQIHVIKSNLTRFHDLDFSFCPDDFLWREIVPMKASRIDSSLTREEIPLLVKSLYAKLRNYRDTNKEGRMMERNRSDVYVVGLKMIHCPSSHPSCMMISKEWLIQGIGKGQYDDAEREVVEDKIDKGFDSLLFLGIQNCAEALDGIILCRETGFLYGKDSKPKYVVKKIESLHCSFVFASLFCSPISSGKIVCGNCAALEIDLGRKAIRRADFRNPGVGVKNKTNHSNILSTPSVAIVYLQSETERRKCSIPQIRYYKCYNHRLREQGVDLSMKCASDLFGEESLMDGLEDLEGRGTIPQGDLIKFLWKQCVGIF